MDRRDGKNTKRNDISETFSDRKDQSSRDDETFDEHQKVQATFSRNEIDSRASEFQKNYPWHPRVLSIPI